MASQQISKEGAKKTAILLLTLGEQFASEILKRMEREELAAVSKAMVELDTAPRDLVDEILREYYHALVTGREMIRGGQEAVKRLLLPNVDSETAKYVSDYLSLDSGPQPFREISKVSTKLLSFLLTPTSRNF